MAAPATTPTLGPPIATTAPHTWRSLGVRLGVFLALIAGLDQLAGLVLTNAHRRVVAGQSIGFVNQAIHRGADVVIFGNSRAKRSYDDHLLSNALGQSVFNAGSDGRGLFYARGLFSLLAKHHPPRFAVLDVVGEGREPVTLLAPYYGETPAVDDALLDGGWRARVKLASHAFRYNGLVFSLLSNLGRTASTWGFSPITGVLEGPDVRPPPNPTGRPVGPWFERALLSFVHEARAHHTQIIFIEGPSWGLDLERSVVEAYARVAAAERVPFLHLDINHEPALARRELFKDPVHLNVDGARIFSGIVAERLRKLIDPPVNAP